MWRGGASLVDKGPATDYFGGCHVLDQRQAFGPMWWGGDPFVMASSIYWTSAFLIKKSLITRPSSYYQALKNALVDNRFNIYGAISAFFG